MQAAGISVLRRVVQLSLKDKVRSSDIRRKLGLEPLLPHIKRSQFRWFGHLIRVPPGHLPPDVFLACPTGRMPLGRPRTCWKDYTSHRAREHLGVPQEKLENIAGERHICAILLNLSASLPGGLLCLSRYLSSQNESETFSAVTNLDLLCLCLASFS